MFNKSSIVLFVTIFFNLAANSQIVRFSQFDKNLFRGGQPQQMSDYQKLKTLNIKTIINLRTTAELIQKEKTIAEGLGMRFYSFPINGMSYPDRNQVNEILKMINDTKNHPLFIHCHLGKDRTSLIVGLYRVFTNKWPSDLAYQEMLHFNFDNNLIGLNNFFWDRVLNADFN